MPHKLDKPKRNNKEVERQVVGLKKTWVTFRWIDIDIYFEYVLSILTSIYHVFLTINLTSSTEKLPATAWCFSGGDQLPVQVLLFAQGGILLVNRWVDGPVGPFFPGFSMDFLVILWGISPRFFSLHGCVRRNPLAKKPEILEADSDGFSDFPHRRWFFGGCSIDWRFFWIFGWLWWLVAFDDWYDWIEGWRNEIVRWILGDGKCVTLCYGEWPWK